MWSLQECLSGGGLLGLLGSYSNAVLPPHDSNAAVVAMQHQCLFAASGQCLAHGHTADAPVLLMLMFCH